MNCLAYDGPALEAVELESLFALEPHACATLCDTVHRTGIGLVTLDASDVCLFEEVCGVAQTYFEATSLEEKNLSAMDSEDHDWGYVHMEGVKEFFQMRPGTEGGPQPPFGSLPASFFERSLCIAQQVLRALDAASPDHVRSVAPLAEEAGRRPSPSIFRFFRYEASAQLGCQVHTDIGLITLIPRSTCAALQVLDPLQFLWFNVEHRMERNQMVVVCGETLEMASEKFFPAAVHRVGPTQRPRMSLVSLFRACPEAELLPSGKTVADFMAATYLSKKSANFVRPGQGLPRANLAGAHVESAQIESWKNLDDLQDQ